MLLCWDLAWQGTFWQPDFYIPWAPRKGACCVATFIPPTMLRILESSKERSRFDFSTLVMPLKAWDDFDSSSFGASRKTRGYVGSLILAPCMDPEKAPVM